MSDFDLSDEAGWPEGLNLRHRTYLAERGVSPQVAAGRGYLSIESKASNKSLGPYGWGKGNDLYDQINNATGDGIMIIPLFHFERPDEPSIHQARPDVPRLTKKGTGPKFEMPYGVNRGTEKGELPADVHPEVSDIAADGTSPLFITEGVPKADAVLSAALDEGIMDLDPQHRIVPVALTGVTMGYRSENFDTPSGPETYRELSENIRDLVEGRDTVYLCWDSDWLVKEQVRNSLARTGRLLAQAGVKNVVYLKLPHPGDDSKAGVDDWLVQPGNTLSSLLKDPKYRMDAPELPEDEIDPTGMSPQTFHVDREKRVMWDWEQLRVGSSSKPQPMMQLKLGAIARIERVLSSRRIIDHRLVPDEDDYQIVVEWMKGVGEEARPCSRTIEVPVAEFSKVSKWLSSDAATGRIHMPTSPRDEACVANTITALSNEHDPETVVTSTTTGWFLQLDDELGDGEPLGWRYLHRDGWIGSTADPTAEADAAEDGEPFTSISAVVQTESSAGSMALPMPEDPAEAKARWGEWFREWVLGELVERMGSEDPECHIRDDDKQSQEAAYVMQERMAFGAMVVARSLMPGSPAIGTPYLEGLAGSGKTLTARAWTSCFGPAFGERPYVSLGSTAAGVEVQVADARNMAVLVDDFKPGGQKEMEAMNRIVDALVRGAYDGATRSRSTRDLRSMKAPQISGSIVLTGEELPSQSSASNSTVQRLLVLRVRKATEQVYRMLNRLTSETSTQQAATAFMVAELARRLNVATRKSESTDDARRAGDATAAVRSQVEAYVDAIESQMNDKAQTSMAARPNERTKMAMRDLLYGGGLLISIARGAGVISTRAEQNKAIETLAEAAATVLVETARAVSETSPSIGVSELITTVLQSETGYITDVRDKTPTDPGAAMTWGLSTDADGNTRARSRIRIGYVMKVEGQVVVALTRNGLASALQTLTRSSDLTRNRLPRLVAEAIDQDAEHILAFGSETEPLTWGKVRGHQQQFLMVRPEAIGVDVSEFIDESDGPDDPDAADGFDNDSEAHIGEA